MVEACPVLGLSWNPQKDTLSIHGSFFEDISMDNLVVTKRQILSMAQRVFDPVGFVTPATLTPKVLLQKLWEKNLSWDAPVDDDTTIKFKRWASELPSLLSIEIPRLGLELESHRTTVYIHFVTQVKMLTPV